MFDAAGRAEPPDRRRGALEVGVLFEHQADDGEPARPVAAVELRQQRRVVVAVRAPAALERHEHDLAAELRIARGNRTAVQVLERELEAGLRVSQARGDRLDGRVRTPLRDEAAAAFAVAPRLADQATLVIEPGLVEHGGAAVESRQPQRLVAYFPRQVALVGGREDDGARDLIEPLRQFHDASRTLACALGGERRVPPTRDVGVVAERFLVEAPGLAERGLERQLETAAFRVHQRNGAFEPATGDRRGQRRLVARHPRRQAAGSRLDFGDTHAFLAVDQVEDRTGLLARDVEPERQRPAARHGQHGPIAPRLQVLAGRLAAGAERQRPGQHRAEGAANGPVRPARAKARHGIRRSARRGSCRPGARRRGP